MSTPPDLWLDPFHQAALTAYCEVPAECGTWPDSRTVQRRAYAIYEAQRAATGGE